MRVMRAAVVALLPGATAAAAVAATRTVRPAARPATGNRAINMSATTGSRLTARRADRQSVLEHPPAARSTIRWAKCGRTAIDLRVSAARSTMLSVRTAMQFVRHVRMVIVRMVIGRKAAGRKASVRKVTAHVGIGRRVTVLRVTARAQIVHKVIGPKARAAKVAAAGMVGAAAAAALTAVRAAAN